MPRKILIGYNYAAKNFERLDGIFAFGRAAGLIVALISVAMYRVFAPQIIRAFIEDYYTLDFTLDEIRPGYGFDVSCQGSVPQAVEAFLESSSFEDAVRGAISLGGDSDTIGAMAGSMAEAFYGIPRELREAALGFLDAELQAVVRKFEGSYPGCVIL